MAQDETLSQEETAALHQLAHRLGLWTGLDFQRGGQIMALARYVRGRAARSGGASVPSYVGSLCHPDDPEVLRLVNAVTVGHTWFYRDGQQLEDIARIFRDDIPPSRTIHVWVAGCATGEDAYTLAMLAAREGRQAVVLGTDINSEVLEHARQGSYGAFSARELGGGLERFLIATPGPCYRPVPHVARMVHFQRHNLMDTPIPSASGAGWDLILCRNVLIYFQAGLVPAALERLGSALATEGWLVLGSAEVLDEVSASLAVEPLGSHYALRRARVRPSTPRPVHTPPRPAVPAAPTEKGNPKLARAARLLATSEVEPALKLYEEVLRAEPLCVEARLWLGLAHHLTGDAVSAVRALRGALVLEPALWPAAYYLAVSYEKLGLRAEAQREYQRLLEMMGRDAPLSRENSPLGDLSLWKHEIGGICRRRLEELSKRGGGHG
ncbi:MAG: CheR family methyltransferase [Myxococcota bacterium]